MTPMTNVQDPRPGPRLSFPPCWTVARVDLRDPGAEGRLRARLLELVHSGYERILVDLSACGDVPLGKLHALGELVRWFDTSFDGSRIDIRALAPDPAIQQLLKDAGVSPRVRVVSRLMAILDEPGDSRELWCSGVPSEQALFLTYALSWPHGTSRELAGLHELADKLAQAVAPSGGELDGYDVVGDQGVFYLYGPDCLVLWDCAQAQAVRDEPQLIGVELRFGGVCAPHVHLRSDAHAAPVCV